MLPVTCPANRDIIRQPYPRKPDCAMTNLAIVLIVTASITHVCWNVLGKKRHPSIAFFFLACLAGVALLTPAVIWNHAIIPQVPTAVWGLLVLTGFWQALYFTGLAAAYAHGHLSVAYPLARALPVLLVALVTVVRRPDDVIHPAAGAGMALILGGALLLPVPGFRAWHWRNYTNRACFFAAVAAVGTTGYSITDDRALQLLRNALAGQTVTVEATLLYAFLEGVSTSLWLLPLIGMHHASRTNVKYLLSKQRATVALAGLGIFLTYSLVLIAMAHVRDVSYVVAFRQLSIPLGALAGIFLLGEPAHGPKLTGVALMFAGLVLTALY